jgi:hypothetical protein
MVMSLIHECDPLNYLLNARHISLTRLVEAQTQTICLKDTPFLAYLADARQVPAWCYNLPQVTGARRNTGYAVRLLEVAKALAFPEDYLDTFQRLTQEVSAT